MAVLKSDIIKLRDTKGTITEFASLIGVVSKSAASLSLDVNVTADDELIMLELPSTSKIYSLRLSNDDLGDTSSFDLGVFAGSKFTDTDGSETVYDKDAVIKVDSFDKGDGGLNNAQLVLPGEYRWQPTGTASDLPSYDDELWQLAGLTSNPKVNLRIGFTINIAFSNFVAGDIYLEATYSHK